MGQFLPLGLGPVLVFGACTAGATVRISQSHSLNGDIGPSHAEVASDHVGFGSGRGNLRPSLGGGIPEEDPIGSELQGSVRIGALRFSGEAAASPFVFDLPARNFASAVLEASFEDSLTLGGVPFGSSLRVGYSYSHRALCLHRAPVRAMRESPARRPPGNSLRGSVPTDSLLLARNHGRPTGAFPITRPALPFERYS